ncbi:MAG: chromosomal replication initiator protein DnaA, partial [Methylococcales bacterium]|nr:chromosomal replication initiator protein DnaA [Methylococcales bacterium]
LSRLENEIPSSDFSTWVRPLQAEENNKQINLLAPNRFVLDWVNQHYFTKFEKVIDEFSNGRLTLNLKVGTKAQKNTAIKKSNARKLTPKKSPSFLNSAFQFDSFVEGQSNQLARAAAVQVTKNVGLAYNPLFIYGNSGLGKTHLMHAIGNALAEKDPKLNIIYLHSEKFVQDMVKSLQQNKFAEFKDYYRQVDVLLVDDIQFLAGKERSQEEFFHTFNTLIDKKHQIVLSCDQYPKEIAGLEDRLKSRFGWGLPVSIEPPDLETRAAILMKKSSMMGIKLPQEVAFFISKRVPSNVRDLEGALRRVVANSQLTGQKITLEFAKNSLQDLIALQENRVNIENIQKTVAEYFKLNVMELLSKVRKQSITRPRQVAMALARELTTHSYPEIGHAFGGRDHTTVISACKRVETLKTSNIKFNEDYLNLLRTLSH